MNIKYGQTGLWVSLFVGIIIALIAISAINTQITGQLSSTTVTDDVFTFSNTTCIDLTTQCIDSISSVENGTGSNVIGAGNYSLCNANAPGGMRDGIQIPGDTYIDNLFAGSTTVNATYSQIQCDAITGSTTRTILAYIPLLAVLALLVFVIAIGGLGKS